MKFLCGSCRTKYQISDEKVRGKILTIRCKKCGAKILVRESLAHDRGGGTAVAPVAEEQQHTEIAMQEQRRSVAASSKVGGAALAHAYDEAMQGHGGGQADDMPTSIAPVPANLDIAGVEWYVAIDGEQHGPYAFAEVVGKVTSGKVQGRNYVWHDGMDGWSRVRDVKDLASYLGSSKKRPPPIPDAGATEQGKVVDLSEKRAERQRQQGLGASAVAPMDADLEQTEVESPESTGIPTPTTSDGTASDRAEQLEDVLNEALGIEGEGRTTRAEPDKAIAVAATAKEGAKSIEDLLSFDNSQEDIFANVPRASDDIDDPQRESTRFFVAAAGVNQKKSRNRVGLLIGLLILLAVGAFIGAWATGVIAIQLPGVGNPFHQDKVEDEFAELDPDTVEDPEALKKLLAGIKDPKRRREIVRRNKQRKAAKVAALGKTDYIDDGSGESNDGTSGPRGAGLDSIKYEGPAGIGTKKGESSVGNVALPSSGVDNIVPVDRKRLDQAAITSVINARKKSVSICYEQSLRGREDLRGKLEFKVTVDPDGHVSRASVETSAFRGSRLGRCIADKIKDWRFPSFEGEAQQIVVPFVLEKHSY